MGSGLAAVRRPGMTEYFAGFCATPAQRERVCRTNPVKLRLGRLAIIE